MNGRAAGGDDRMLRRIIARLVALAVVAEQAAGRCWPVRLFVLFLLRRAEARMTDFVAGETGMPPVLFDGMTAVGDDGSDALVLAARFRAFAAILAALLPDACLADRRPARPVLPPGAIALRPGLALADWTPEPFDTS